MDRVQIARKRNTPISSPEAYRDHMRLVWLTDLHLNFVARPRLKKFIEEVAGLKPDAVLLGGDVGEAGTVAGFLEALARAWQVPIYFVLGNRDFYHGSLRQVYAEIAALTQRVPALTCLSGAEPILLPGGTLLVGTDGWGDGGYGDAVSSHVRPNDFMRIEEVQVTPPGEEQRALLAELGRRSATQLQKSLSAGIGQAGQVICLTHVPPFREATWHEGKISDDAWLPWFACRATGEVLRAMMATHPGKQMLVLCGHTHSAGECEVLPNLRVLTGGSEYHQPRVQRVIDVEDQV